MAKNDLIGNRGENICIILLTDFACGGGLPLFKTTFLGEKFEALDFMVELLDGDQILPFIFFIQVKTTQEGYTGRGRRLKVRVSTEEMKRLISFPCPTYIVGIDEGRGTGYIVSANDGVPARISSLSTQFELNCDNLKRLWEEVKNFWAERDMSLKGSVFSG